jgi:hypothetical protein
MPPPPPRRLLAWLAWLSALAALAVVACGSATPPSGASPDAGQGAAGAQPDAGGPTGGPTGGPGGAPGGNGGNGQAGAGGQAAPEPAQLLYPTMRVLMQNAIVPSCSLNQGQCHAGWAAPDLGTFDQLIASFGAPCQQRVGNPAVIVDACERPGDRLAFADGTERGILYVEVPPGSPAAPAKVEVYLDGPPGEGPAQALTRLLLDETSAAWKHPLDAPSSPGHVPTSVWLDLSALPEADAAAWDLRAWPRPEGGVIVGDPNANGVAGASLGWRQLIAGDPDRSYLYQRLLSDDLGARMPLVQGTWGPEATRALYCFLRETTDAPGPGPGLLDAPIAYASCPQDPGATHGFAAVASVMSNRCALAGCHDAQAHAGSLDLTPTSNTFAAGVVAAPSQQAPGRLLVKPGSPADSYLFCKVDPSCPDRAEDTELMPRSQTPLDALELDRLRAWIEDGAPLE